MPPPEPSHSHPLTFRTATPSDAPTIAALTQLAFRHLDPLWTGPHPILNKTYTHSPSEVLSTIASPTAAILLATDPAGALVASVAVARKSDDLARLASLVVDPERQAAGIGARVLAYAEEYVVKVWGVRRMGLNALGTRERLLGWYEKVGYVRTGERTAFPVERLGELGIEEGLYFVEMEKELGRDGERM